MSIVDLYNTFIDGSLIRDSQTLINTLKGFPYYFEVLEYNNTLLIKATKKTDEYSYSDEFDIYKNLLRNLIINKLNHLEFYYFGKQRKEIQTIELLKELKTDMDLKKNIFYKSSHSIKYFLYYMNNNWCISSEGKLDIYSLNSMSLFEKYTLYELLFQAFTFYKITLKNFDKKYNYVLTLNSHSTFLTVFENNNVGLEIHSIINNTTNIPIVLNRKSLERLKLRLSIPVQLYFDNVFHFKKDIYLSLNQRLIIKNIETKEERIYNYPKFYILHKFLQNFNKDPIRNVFDLMDNGNLECFLNSFPLYKFFITNFIRIIKDKEDYLFKKYVNIYIRKITETEYLPYDKELLLKIHLMYQRYRRHVTRLDVHRVLFELKTEKIQKILKINYNLLPNIENIIPIVDYSHCD